MGFSLLFNSLAYTNNTLVTHHNGVYVIGFIYTCTHTRCSSNEMRNVVNKYPTNLTIRNVKTMAAKELKINENYLTEIENGGFVRFS